MTHATIALSGNPNAGKTTLFNALTGARQHVGNYPGVTVEKKSGFYIKNGHKIHIVDLPGTYSLTAYSLEEVVARDFLINEKPAMVVDIVDASNLERNLYLTVQLMELGVPVCIALNMMDVAENRGITIDAEKLSAMMAVPVVPMVARAGQGKKELMDAVVQAVSGDAARAPLDISYGKDIDTAVIDMTAIIERESFLTETYPARWIALKYLEGDEQIRCIGARCNPSVSARLDDFAHRLSQHLEQTAETYPEAIIADHRYGYIKSIIRQGIVAHRYDHNRLYVSDRIDKVLTHRLAGPLVMVAVLFGLYHFTFTYSKLPVSWTEGLFAWLSGTVSTAMPPGLLRSLVVSGIIDGVGGVLGFVPLIMFMFFGIAILEDSGYLARVAYMLDRIFRLFGLHGSSVMPFIVSGGIAGGCAVPGIMATRTLKSPRERLATLLTVPFMNCGAKLPVFALLVAAFFSRHEARMMFLITIIAWLGALLTAKFLRVTVIRGASTPFVLELPPYRFPTLKGLLIHTWERTWHYIRKAGTVILSISILLWAMMTFPMLPESIRADFQRQRQEIIERAPVGVVSDLERHADSPAARQLREELAAVDRRQAEVALRGSVAGRIGIALETISRWAGFDWRTNIALIGGFAAKEVVVSTLGTAYSLGAATDDNTGSLAAALAKSPSWRPLTALSLMLFVMFYAPCFVSVICIVRESGSWKWGAFSVAFNTVFAFVLASAVYQIGSWMGY